jgi:hypothetical protein
MMHLKPMLLILFVVCLSFGTVRAEDSTDSGWKSISLTANIEYVSKYMWRGFDALSGTSNATGRKEDDDGAVQPQVLFLFGNTGMYAGIWSSFAAQHRDSWHVWDEFDYYAGFGHQFFKDKPFTLSTDLNYTFFDYPWHKTKNDETGRLEKDRMETDTQEIGFSLELPNLIHLDRISVIPVSAVYYGWPVRNSSLDNSVYVKAMVRVVSPLPEALCTHEDHNILFYLESYHNSGGGAYQANPGWSHLAAGVASTFSFAGIDITPSLNYQWSIEKTVNPENEFWFKLNVSAELL